MSGGDYGRRQSWGVQLERFEYWKKIAAFDLKQLVFLDETGIQLGITQRYARSEQGQKAYGTSPYPHGNIIILLGAMKFDGVVATMTVWIKNMDRVWI